MWYLNTALTQTLILETGVFKFKSVRVDIAEVLHGISLYKYGNVSMMYTIHNDVQGATCTCTAHTTVGTAEGCTYTHPHLPVERSISGNERGMRSHLYTCIHLRMLKA